jgi:hypothetical protein
MRNDVTFQPVIQHLKKVQVIQRIGSLYSATRGFQMKYQGRCSRDMSGTRVLVTSAMLEQYSEDSYVSS